MPISKRFAFLFISLLSVGLIALSVIVVKKAGYSITYQVTPSMPKGFYLVTPPNKIERGDIVLFYPPKDFLVFLRTHHWIPKSGMLMKYVMGIPNDQVCNDDGIIQINNRKIAQIYKFYASGKPLPIKRFCGKLGFNQYLLLSTKIKRSFDGRYFGPIKREQIIGKAVKLF